MNLDSTLKKIERRYDIPLLIPMFGVSIELGVAEGGFSEAVLNYGRGVYHYGVDRYSGERNHTDDEYLTALKRLEKYRNRFSLIRADFSVARKLFPDEYFDFIYIDGYAHTGQENGRTLAEWWPKVKPGGFLVGDDYSSHWPLVVEVADKFAAHQQRKLHVISCKPEHDWASQEPSWLIQK